MFSQPIHPRFWFALSLGAVFTFIILALAIHTQPMTALDLVLGNFMHEAPFHRIPYLSKSMRLATYLGYEGVVVTAVIGTIVMALRRWWSELIIWITTISGAIIINRLMKGQFETVRQMVGHPDVLEVSTGFPSGHTMMSLVAYGVLAYIISQHVQDRRQKQLVFIAAGLLIGLIALTRLYLTVHYLSDVLGGFACGSAWLGLCMGLFAWLHERKLTGKNL